MPEYSRMNYSDRAISSQYRSSVLNIETFKGVDMTTQPVGVSEKRTADGTNMIRDTIGKVRKRMGYKLTHQYGSKIYGIYEFKGALLVHAGTKLYVHGDTPTQLCSTMAQHRSQGIHIAEKMVILDGTTLGLVSYSSGTYSYATAAANAYVPTVYIGVNPGGGGTPHDKPNRLTPYRIDSFSDDKDGGGNYYKTFQLSYVPISNQHTVSVWVMDAGGTWQQKELTTDFTVDHVHGTVTFEDASVPGASPITGEDNVRIQYGVDSTEYINSINKCTFGISYGFGGKPDRVFISGNPDYKNQDFWCAVNNPNYWQDIDYGALGMPDSPITGYSIINNTLATHKLNDDDGRNIYVRTGSVDDDNNITFPIDTIIQGDGALTPYCFGYQIEPLFLTKGGVCATTPYTYNSERHIQNRSYYINGALKLEKDLDKAIGATYKEYFLVCLNSKIYAIDTMQRAYDSGNARSESQYECYYWTGIDVQAMHEFNGVLYFGDSDGNLCEFYTEPTNPKSYSDWTPKGLRAIPARWDVLFDGVYFNKMKRILHLGIRLSPYAVTSVAMWRLMRGEWSVQFDNEGTRVFDFTYMDFNNFTFDTGWDNYTINRRLNMRRIDNVRFSWRNEKLNEPFSIYELIVEASENGYYKGV